MTREEMLSQVESLLSYKFKDISNLNRALTHSSYRNQPNNVSPYRSINECMEFLGDSVLDFVISEYLYNIYSDWNEGRLSKFRSKVVCEQSLVIVAKRLRLWGYILVGRGEASGEDMNPSIMADAVEAVIAAVYLDGGLEEARSLIMRLLKENIDDIVSKKILRDSKTELQELLQGIYAKSATYEVISRVGPQHDAVYTVAAMFEGQELGRGEGKNKKEAEQAAATEAIQHLNKEKLRRKS